MKRNVKYFLGTLFLFSELLIAHVGIVSPFDGESFEVGEQIVIKWEVLVDHGPSTYTIEYTIDDGNNWIEIISGLSQETFSYEWNIPEIETSTGGIKIIQVNDNSNDYSSIISNLKFGLTTSVNDEILNPRNFELNNIYPNPFNNNAIISYSLSKQSEIQLVIFDIKGSQVKILENKIQRAGKHELIWDAAGMSSGTYFLLLKSDKYFTTRKLVLLK